MKHVKRRVVKSPEERRQEIIKAAVQLFSQKGYENTTIQDIAEMLNISQGLCYRYFKSKSDIFMAAGEFYAQQVMAQIKAPFPVGMNAVDKFNIIVKRAFEYIVKHSEFEVNARFYEFRADRLDYVSKQVIEVIIPIIEQGNKEGVFNCKNAEQVGKIFIFGVVHTFHEEVPKNNIREYVKNLLQTLR